MYTLVRRLLNKWFGVEWFDYYWFPDVRKDVMTGQVQLLDGNGFWVPATWEDAVRVDGLGGDFLVQSLLLGEL